MGEDGMEKTKVTCSNEQDTSADTKVQNGAHACRTPTGAELNGVVEKLKIRIDAGLASASDALAVLDELHGLRVDMGTLRSTKIGVSVNFLRRHESDAVRAGAKAL